MDLTYGQQCYRKRLEIREKPEYLGDYGERVEVVPERLTRARLEACWSLEELADQIACSHTYLSQAEWDGVIGRRALVLISDICEKPQKTDWWTCRAFRTGCERFGRAGSSRSGRGRGRQVSIGPSGANGKMATSLRVPVHSGG